MLRNRIVFGILIVSSSLLVYYEPNLITSIFFHTVVYIILLSSAHMLYTFLKVKVGQSLDPNIVEHGRTAKYKCSVHNESLLPTSAVNIDFLFNSDMFKGQLDPQTFALKKGKAKEFDFDLSCNYRGVYSLGIETLEVMDFLNIFKMRFRNIESKNITVLPKVTQLVNFSIPPKAESDIKAVSSITAEGANSMVDIRKFHQGDPLKHIHWKLSARYNELLVRNLERSAQNSTLIFLDTSKGKYDFATNIIVEDKLMEALVSVVNQCLFQHHIIQFNYFAFAPLSHTYSAKEDFGEFFTTVSKLSFGQSTSIKSLVDEYFESQHYSQNLWGKDVFIFTCHPELLENQNTIQKLLGHNCSVNVISSAYTQKNTGAYRTSEGIYYYNLSPECDIQDIFVRSIE
ncbi:MAG: DUF58 domain-containing protein [Eubacteriales bacterium]